MFRAIELVMDWWAEVERGPGRPLEQVRLRRGDRHCARVQPRVVERPDGPAEAADLYFADGSVARGVPFAAFRFPDQ